MYNIIKKLFITILIFCCGITALTAINTSKKVKADSNFSDLKTELFLPSTYFEYYKLNSPSDICEDDNFVYIAETNPVAIVIYEKPNPNSASQETYKRIDLNGVTIGGTLITDIKKIDCYNGNIFFISSSQLFYLPNTATSNADIIKTNLFASTYFTITKIEEEHFIFVNSNDSISQYQIVFDNNAINFEKVTEFPTTASAISFTYSNSTSSLYYFTGNETSKINLNGIKDTAFKSDSLYTTQYVKAEDGKLYYTYNNKFFAYIENTKGDRDTYLLADLSSLCLNEEEIKGFSLYKNNVLIVHANKNEIYMHDLTSGLYTGTSVTTTKNAVNRLTENVNEIVYDNGYIYALQKESLLRFSTIQKEYKQVVFPQDFILNNPSYATYNLLAVNNNLIVISNGKDVKCFKLKLENGVLNAETIACDLQDNIAGIYCFDNNFYILKNEMIDNVSSALIIKASYDEKNNTLSYKKADNQNNVIFSTVGTGKSLTVNSFGELYILLNNNKIVCSDIVNNTGKEITEHPYKNLNLTNATKIFSDFENLYVLENNTIKNLKTSQTFVVKNDKLPTENAVSITIDLSSANVYLLYKGYILQTKDLPLTTPNSFKTPLNLNSTYYTDIVTYKLNSGAKLFEVSTSKEFLNCSNVTSCLDKEYIFVSNLQESSSFCLINYEYKSYIARKVDLIETQLNTFTPTITNGYYVTRAGLYGLPILNYEQYKTSNVLGPFRLKTIYAFAPVTILGGISINNVKFYIVKLQDNTTGYIQADFIAEKINYFLADVLASNVYNENGEIIGTISPKKVKVYGKDNNMFVIDYNGGYGYVNLESIKQSTNNRETYTLIKIKDTTFTAFSGMQSEIKSQQVKVYGQENGKYIIEYNGEYGYVNANAVIHPKNKALRNALVVILVATSFCATAIFLLVRYCRKKEI